MIIIISTHDRMSNQVVKLWQQVLNRLSSPDIGEGAALSGCLDLLGKLELKTEQPRATWKAVIQDMQVCGLYRVWGLYSVLHA